MLANGLKCISIKYRPGEPPMSITMTMVRIDIKKAQTIAKNKGLSPGRVKGTTGLQFVKGQKDKLEIISWDEFEKALEAKGLAIYEDAGYMRIMKIR